MLEGVHLLPTSPMLLSHRQLEGVCWDTIHTKIHILILNDYMRRKRTCDGTEYSDINQNILTPPRNNKEQENTS
jgi:hypothetical protein